VIGYGIISLAYEGMLIEKRMVGSTKGIPAQEE
jgi:hypothetical protein